MKSLIIIWALAGITALGVYVYGNVVVNESVNRGYAEQSRRPMPSIQTINPQATTNPQETMRLQDTVAPYENVRK